MKKHLLTLLFTIAVMKAMATGAPSTHFNIFLPPNNDATQRHVALIVTAIYDSTSFNIIDDDMDGDSDDSYSGMLMAGQSYVLYIKDNGVNDDADGAAPGNKADGDYFIVNSDKIVYASQSTNSDWQHDWVPATNQTSKGQKFIVYAPQISSSNRDINVFAYEDNTTVTVRKISTYSTLSTGYTQVDTDAGNIVIQKSIDIGQDIINYYTDGRDVMESGHTYLIESNKPITVQYGALHVNARDGGGYVPSNSGSSIGELFYFSVPFQANQEQEIRIISVDDNNQVALHRYQSGAWIEVKDWTLDRREPGEWVGRADGGVTYSTVFRVTCTPGKRVMVLEANWMETGSIGTSDMATMASSMSGSSSGTEFLAYMAPPGYENNVLDPFTGTNFSAGSHAYLFASSKAATVTVKDANTGGQVIDRTYTIEAGRYADCNLNQSEWLSIYNGDGNPNSGADRPYLIIESDENISVLVTNFNDNWMNYFGSSLKQSFLQTSSSSSTHSAPGDTVSVITVVNNTGSQVDDASVEVIVPDGLTPISSNFVNNSTSEVYEGVFVETTTGQFIGDFETLTQLEANTAYTVETYAVVDLKYNDGSVIDEDAVFSVETISSGMVEGVYQQTSSASGISVSSSNMSNMFFALSEAAPWNVDFTDSWTANWVDYDGDNDLDLFVPSYSRSQPNLLYENIGNGQFQQFTAPMLGMLEASSVASTWGDYDNDGDVDVVIANNLGQPSVILINDGVGNFTVKDSGIDDIDGYDHGVSWVDYDNDGLLDVFAVDFLSVRFNRLFKGDGINVIRNNDNLLSKENKRAIGASWADYDNDGYQDLFIPNGTADGAGDYNSLYRNLGNGRFEKVTTGSIATDKFNSVASAWGDYNNDGYLDLYVANASKSQNQLYKNNGDGTFIEQNIAPFNQHFGNSHGASWLDYDNDADLDLFVTNNNGQPNYLYRNNGNGSFTSIDYEYIATLMPEAMGASVADMDRDGDLDVFITTRGGNTNKLFVNNGNNNHWLSVKLVGTVSNRSAIGARLRVKANIEGESVWQSRQVSSQSGFGGQNSLNQHFGLVSASIVDSVEVIWPSGIKQYLTEESINQELVIVEAETATITGIVFVDDNENCVYDEGERGIPGVAVLNGGQKVFSDDNGMYTMQVLAGDHTVSIGNSAEWMSTCAGNVQVSVSSLSSSYENNNLPILSKYNAKDLRVTLGTTALRRGFKNQLIVTYENNGTVDAYNQTLTVDLGNVVVPLSSSQSWDVNLGSTFVWYLDTIKVGRVYTIAIEDSISLAAPLSQLVDLSANLTSVNDYNPADNTFLLQEEVVGAVDPNDIQAFPAGFGKDHLIASSQTLIYKIRFQNTGNYYAENVKVEDLLPEYIDMESFKMISASHDYRVMMEGAKVTWYFDKIHLPDSTRDEPNSHGFISFAVNIDPHVPSGSELHNKAAISFDFEKPVITNTVWHTVMNGNMTMEGNIRVFPNPMDDRAIVTLSDYGHDSSEITEAIIVDVTGVIKKKMSVNGGALVLTDENLSAGMYILQITDKEGKVFSTRLLVK